MLSGIGGRCLNPIKKQPLENLVSDLVGTAAALNLPVGGAYHVFLLRKVSAPNLVEFLATVRTEYHSREYHGLAHH